MSNLTRRSFLKSSGLVAGAAGITFSGLFGYEKVFAQDDGDTVETILNIAATAETLACTHYYNVLTDSDIQLTPAERAILTAALDTEYQHLQFLNANGGEALTQEFFFPLNVYVDRENFSNITEMAETAFVGAYLAAGRRFAELGNPLLAATASQVACTEEVHLALIRQIGGRLPNHVSLAQAVIFNVSDAAPVLQGFLEGGTDFTDSPSGFPGGDAITSFVGDNGVMSIEPFVSKTF